MRLLFVVQRYGREILGGGERACREYATRMAARGHHVEVLTSRARSYVDWANAYPEGTERDEGLLVHRLSVRATCDPRIFGPLDLRVNGSGRMPAFQVQQEWLRLMGPELDTLPGWLRDRAADFDVVIFFTYLYPHTNAGITASAGVTPIVMHPLAHREPHIRLSVYEPMFRLTDAFVFLTEEEQGLVTARFRPDQPAIITGVGIDLGEIDRLQAEPEAFRRRFGITRDYLLYVGRIDESKGVRSLLAAHRLLTTRNPNAPMLVLMGELVHEMELHEGVITTGAADEETKHAAIEGCLALVQPSHFESFSIVLCEAWAHRRPALVNGYCSVLTGQAHRSGGALPYRTYAEFEAATSMLAESAELCTELGTAGYEYVRARYEWDHMLERYERFLEQVAISGLRTHGARRSKLRASGASTLLEG